MKKHLLAIVALVCSLTASAHDFEDRRVYYNIISETDQTVEVTFRGDSYDSYSNEYSNRVTIPSEVTYNGKNYSVTGIGTDASSGCSSLTSITIPEGVTSIGVNAFYDCSSLTSITIPASVTNIGGSAFAGCSSLAAITIPEGVTRIESFTFSRCSSLKTITIPESVTSIKYQAFISCSSLKEIHIGSIESWLTINYETSYSHPNYNGKVDLYIDGVLLTEVDLPSTITCIPSYAFYGCSSLTSITIPASVTNIESGALIAAASPPSLALR